MVVMLKNALILCIVMYGAFLLLFLMLDINILTFIDDFGRYTWVYFLRLKSKVLSIFQTFVAYVETQFSTGTKILRFDSSGEIQHVPRVS